MTKSVCNAVVGWRVRRLTRRINSLTDDIQFTHHHQDLQRLRGELHELRDQREHLQSILSRPKSGDGLSWMEKACIAVAVVLVATVLVNPRILW